MHAQTSPRPGRASDDIGDRLEAGARAASPGIELLGRLGYAAKGVVYLLIGVLAVQAAMGEGGETTDKAGALGRIAEMPFGKALLVIVIVGLFGYALWRAVQGLMDTENEGSEPKGLLKRAMYVGIGGVYVGLAFSAVSVLMGAGAGSGSTESTQGWTAWLMSQPFGYWLVALVGIAVAANGIAQFVRAFKSNLTEDLNLTDVGAQHVDLVTKIGRAGYAARGVSFLMIGGFLVGAAFHHNPDEARGLDGILATLAGQPFGPYLLGLVATGLAAYGLFTLVEARYRRMVVR